jgi:hypothetical protein
MYGPMLGGRPTSLRRAAAGISAAVVIAGLLVACNALTGSGDLTVRLDGDDASTEGADASPPVPPGACPSAGRRCVAAPPQGWDGPLFLYEGAEADVPACPTSMALTRVEAHGGAPTGGHTCSACSCGPATGITCSAMLTQFNSTTCTNQIGATTPIGTACVTTTVNVDSVSVSLTATGGSCAAQGGAATLEPIAWAGAVKACGAPTLLPDGCATGELCAPEPEPPFEARYCIAKKGDEACPPAFPDRLVAHEDVEDTRACSPCQCSPPAATCTGSLHYYAADANCAGASQSSPLPVTCRVVADLSGVHVSDLIPAGSCTAVTAASTPTGEVKAKAPVTVCCRAP